MNATGAPTSPSTALTWRAVWSWAACSAVAAASIFSSATAERAIEVGLQEQRQHVVVEDRLALAVRQVRGLEPGRGIELDLAVLQARIEVEEDDQPVVEPGSTDAPLVDQRSRAGLRLARSRCRSTPVSWV